jgi:tRNA(Ser,Leu) C12 N-acetylase TAN1
LRPPGSRGKPEEDEVAETGTPDRAEKSPPAVSEHVVDWNVVVTLPERTFREACRLLGKWGTVRRTTYYNVLAMTVADPVEFMRQFEVAVQREPGIMNFVSHVVPAQATFDFQTGTEFEANASRLALQWVPRLAGGGFHVRLHRRGFKDRLSRPVEERFLDDALLKALGSAGAPGRIDFRDPDVVIQIETIDGRAGMSLWTRDELRRCRFLGPA